MFVKGVGNLVRVTNRDVIYKISQCYYDVTPAMITTGGSHQRDTSEARFDYRKS